MIRLSASERIEQSLRCHCYGGGTDTSSYAQAVADTKTTAIKQGQNAINAVFGGGLSGANPASSYVAGTNYFDASGNPVTVDMTHPQYQNYINTYYSDTGDTDTYRTRAASSWIDAYNKAVGQFGQDKVNTALQGFQNTANTVGWKNTNPGTSDYGKLVAQAGGDTSVLGNYTTLADAQKAYGTTLDSFGNWLATQGQLYTGTQENTGFNDAFYQKRADDYTAYAMPQLAAQEQKTEKDLAYNMANRGLMKSGAYNSLLSSLGKEVATQKQGIVDTGQSQANTLKSQVESQKESLYSQLASSADTSSAASLALSSASSLSSPATYSPISNLLSNWSNTYLNSLASNSSSGGTQYYNPKSYSAPTPANTVSP